MEAFLWLRTRLTVSFFASEPFMRIKAKCAVHEVVFDQCMYDLRLPGAAKHVLCRERMKVIGNFDISSLQRNCVGISATHQHEFAWGSRTVQGKTVKLARAAGRYPWPLARAFARCMHSGLAEACATCRAASRQ